MCSKAKKENYYGLARAIGPFKVEDELKGLD